MTMKYFKSCFFALLTLFSLMSTHAAAMSIGREGDAYEQNGIKWQPVKFEDSKRGFHALLPGEPHSGISTPWYYVFSEYDNCQYEIHTHMSERYAIPKSKKEFLSSMKELLGQENSYKMLKSKNSTVVYAVEVKFPKTGATSKLIRLYLTTDERIYFALVEGSNLSLANDFFRSIKFY